MKSIRRGLGRGKGMGYKNIVPHDRPVHQQSAHGIKQPQIKMIPPVMMKQGMRKFNKRVPEGWAFVDWEDATGKRWHDAIPHDDFVNFQARVISAGGNVLKCDLAEEDIIKGGLGDKPTAYGHERPRWIKDALAVSDKYGVDVDGKLIPFETEDFEKARDAAHRWKGKVVNLSIIRKSFGKEKIKGGLGDKFRYNLVSPDENGRWFVETRDNSNSQSDDNTNHGFNTKAEALRFISEHKKNHQEKIIGGLGDNRPDSDFPKAELKKGMKVESEHTNNPAIAKEIVKDHLTEFPKGYYEELDKMEKKLKKQQKTSHFHFKGEYPNLKKYQR